jgi:hypothetical protein
MAISTLTKNLRDGTVVVSDGTGTPKTLTLLLDSGDLSWTESEEAVQVLDRGVLDHTREGDQVPVDISFSVKWVQLLAESLSGGSDRTLYEMVNNTNSTYTTTGGTGQKYSLKYEFTVNDASGVKNEKITFAKVYKKSMQLGEGADWNTIQFDGCDFERRPTITHDV